MPWVLAWPGSLRRSRSTCGYNGRAATMNTSGSLMRWIALAFQHTPLVEGPTIRYYARYGTPTALIPDRRLFRSFLRLHHSAIWQPPGSPFIREHHRSDLSHIGYFGLHIATKIKMNSTEVQNPRRKMHVLLLAEPKTPPGLHNTMNIIETLL